MVDLVEINQIISFINEKWLILIFRILCAGIAILLLKTVMENITAYIMLRLDPYLKQGTLIEIDGRNARIKAIHIFRIEIELKEGYMTVPTRNWRNLNWIVLKDMVAIQSVKPYKVEPDLKDPRNDVL